jgi:hypothetical protein
MELPTVSPEAHIVDIQDVVDAAIQEDAVLL